jgi:hypothetical protein
MARWGQWAWDQQNHPMDGTSLSTGRQGAHGYNRAVSRFYVLDEANALLPDLAIVVERLREQRDALVGLRDAYRERETVVLGGLITADPLTAQDDAGDPDLRLIRLRMRGIVDQMQAGAAWLDERGIVLRDIGSGLLDVPALVAGRPAWLCWLPGEPEIGWWHRQDEGFAGRRPIATIGDTGTVPPP